tara:strand:+ start:120 stop:410 length:291 start_codon:yes stop_codon:yes gene_type:complete
MNEVRLVRLTTGEEILCEIHEQTEKSMTVKDPVLLIPNKDQIGFMPYMPYTEIGIFGLEIKQDHVMFNLQPTDEMIDSFNKMTYRVQGIEKPKIVT